MFYLNYVPKSTIENSKGKLCVIFNSKNFKIIISEKETRWKSKQNLSWQILFDIKECSLRELIISSILIEDKKKGKKIV